MASACGAKGIVACRECILAEADARHKCPLCREGITAEGLREGILPGDDGVAGQAGQGADMKEEAPGPSTRLFESQAKCSAE